MADGGGGAPARWGTAIALAAALLLLSVVHAFPLVVLPLAVLLVGLPGARRARILGGAVVVWMVAVGMSDDVFGMAARGWALALACAFLFASLWRPGWGVLPRALLALALTFTLGAAGVAVSGTAPQVDAMVRDHFEQISEVARQGVAASAADPRFVAQFTAATTRMAELRSLLFPATLGLQSLAALALVAWAMARFGRPEDVRFHLRPLRDFRFSDPLVWVLIAGILLVALPMGEVASRVGYNAIAFMGGLYALRGVGVFLFLTGGALSRVALALVALAVFILFTPVLTAAVLVGLGDTWLDVRGRAALAPRA